ncbi:MAG TPA: response regulator [Ktedonobacteraceae bacterium]|jgi:DNA-binding response OmpR family regulator
MHEVLQKSLSVHSLTILFVDSDRSAQTRMQEALGNSFSVRCVGSVQEAKEYLHTDLLDILISETVLDQESGLDLCRYVREQPELQHLPIMLLTSRSTLDDKVAGFEAGADDYVVKPFDAHHLQARIRLLARIKRLEDHLHI